MNATAPSSPDKISVNYGEPRFYLLNIIRGRVTRWNGPPWADADEAYEQWLVMSHGRSVRAYWKLRGALYLAHFGGRFAWDDFHVLEWPKLDAEVERAMGVELRPPPGSAP